MHHFREDFGLVACIMLKNAWRGGDSAPVVTPQFEQSLSFLLIFFDRGAAL